MPTEYSVVFRPISGVQVGPNQFQANVGQLFSIQAVIAVTVDGHPAGEVAPSAVQWNFGGGSQAVASYQPTVAAAAPNLNINLQANPVRLFYWFPQVPGGTSIVPISCSAQVPNGPLVQGNGTLDLVANAYQFVGVVQGQIQLEALPDGNTLLSYGDSLTVGTPGFAIAYSTAPGADYPGWLGAIQLVNGVRRFIGQSGTIYELANTNGQFVLDGAATDPDYIYGKVEVEEGEIAEYTFDDTPNQQLLPVINKDPIVRFEVGETFHLYIVFNGSTSPAPNNNPAQIWFSVAPFITWGWQATVVNDGNNVWQITGQQVIGPTPGGFQLPSWQGTIR
jgi:hypothetical protein